MQNIKISLDNSIARDQLQQLFLSVGWDSGNYPDKLQVAINNSDRVVTAWAGDKLVGLLNALDDGIMTAYFHYMVVHPDFHGKGIARMLMQNMLDHYSEYARKILISYDETIDFYKSCGFEVGHGKTSMFVTYLKT